jgi:hypothetical protein
MAPKSIAEEWETKIHGFVEECLEIAQANPDSSVLRNVLNFLAWEPTEEDRQKIAFLRRLREGPRFSEDECQDFHAKRWLSSHRACAHE